MFPAAGITVPDDAFLTYMAGQYNSLGVERFHETKGECVQYVKLQKGNHFAITDWNPNTAPHQVTPCLPYLTESEVERRSWHAPSNINGR